MPSDAEEGVPRDDDGPLVLAGRNELGHLRSTLENMPHRSLVYVDSRQYHNSPTATYNELQRMRGELEQLNVKFNSAKTNLDELQARNIALETNNTELINSLQEWRASWSRAHEHLEAMTKERDRLQTERDELQTERDELWTERNRLWTERNRPRTERDRLRTERGRLQTEKDELHARNRELKTESQQNLRGWSACYAAYEALSNT